MSGARPDFILIGAMKCGTTTLAGQLAAQDGVFITTPKEPNFFSDDAVYARGCITARVVCFVVLLSYQRTTMN